MNEENLADRIRKWYESYETAPPWSSVVGLVVRERKQERERIIEIVERAREETEKEHGSPNVYIDMVSEVAIEDIKGKLK